MTTITVSGSSNNSNLVIGSTGATITESASVVAALPELLTPLKSKQHGIDSLSKMWGYTGTKPVVTTSGAEPTNPFLWPNSTTTPIAFYTPDNGGLTNTVKPSEGLIEHDCADFSTQSGRRTDIYNIFYTQQEGSYFYLFAEISGNGPNCYHPNKYMVGGKADGTQFNVMVLIRIPIELNYFEGICAHYNEQILQPTTQELFDYFTKYFGVLFRGESYPNSDPLIFYGIQLPSWAEFAAFATRNTSFGLKVNPTRQDILNFILQISTTGVERSIWNTGSNLLTG